MKLRDLIKLLSEFSARHSNVAQFAHGFYLDFAEKAYHSAAKYPLLYLAYPTQKLIDKQAALQGTLIYLAPLDEEKVPEILEQGQELANDFLNYRAFALAKCSVAIEGEVRNFKNSLDQRAHEAERVVGIFFDFSVRHVRNLCDKVS